nr:uncharacterized protein LOC105349212 isoform X1 [Crassostrea gigas]
MHRSVIFIYATILCIGGCNGSATNGSRKTDEDQEINRISFLATWIHQTDNHKQTHLLECLNNKTCPVKVIRNDINTCLCTTDVCAKIECNGSGKSSHLTINCKIEMVLVNHVDCSVFVVIDDLSYGPIRKYICTSCSRKMFSIKEIRLQAIVLSDWDTLTTVDLGERDDMKSHEGVFDAFGNCSDSAYITAFSTIRKSVLYLCVTGNCQNLCIISKCKDGIQSNERNSQYFPKEIAFVISGILVFVGTIGFLMGVKRSRHRKAKLQITREVSRQHHPHNSEVSADINISEPPLSSGAQKVEEENLLESLELENIMSTRVTSTDCLVPNFTSRHNLDDVYNSYNVLEPNYG